MMDMLFVPEDSVMDGAPLFCRSIPRAKLTEKSLLAKTNNLRSRRGRYLVRPGCFNALQHGSGGARRRAFAHRQRLLQGIRLRSQSPARDPTGRYRAALV